MLFGNNIADIGNNQPFGGRDSRPKDVPQPVVATPEGFVAMGYRLEPIIDRDSKVRGFELLGRPRYLNSDQASAPINAVEAFFKGIEARGPAAAAGVDLKMIALAQELAARHPDKFLTVNLSGLSLRSDDWCRRVRAALKDSPSTARQLVFEITERFPASTGDARRFIRIVRDSGAGVWLDDCLAGEHTLPYIQRTYGSNRPDAVKIDYKAVHEYVKGEQGEVNGLLDLARRWGVKVIAEGVETVRDVVCMGRWANGVDYLQGHYFKDDTARIPTRNDRARFASPRRTAGLNS